MDSIAMPIEEFQKALVEINRIKAAEIFESCFVKNKNFEALEHMTIGALEHIGTGWENGQLSLAQVYMSGIICEELIEQYMPKFSLNSKKNPRIGIGVLQDQHALGKRIVTSVLRAGGYEVLDFGQGLSVEEIVDKTTAEKIEILLVSTLMLASAMNVKKVAKILREKNLSVKIIAGGAPFRLDHNLWKKVDIDADGKSGTEVSKIIEKLIQGESSR